MPVSQSPTPAAAAAVPGQKMAVLSTNFGKLGIKEFTPAHLVTNHLRLAWGMMTFGLTEMTSCSSSLSLPTRKMRCTPSTNMLTTVKNGTRARTNITKTRGKERISLTSRSPGPR